MEIILALLVILFMLIKMIMPKYMSLVLHILYRIVPELSVKFLGFILKKILKLIAGVLLKI